MEPDLESQWVRDQPDAILSGEEKQIPPKAPGQAGREMAPQAVAQNEPDVSPANNVISPGATPDSSFEQPPKKAPQDSKTPRRCARATLNEGRYGPGGFTTRLWDNTVYPIEVEDIFLLGSRRLIIFRTTVQVFLNIVAYTVAYITFGWVLLLVLTILTSKYRDGRNSNRLLSAPTIKEIWSPHKWPQWFWEFPMFFIASKGVPQRAFVQVWWFIYFLLADWNDFERNYLNAWLRKDDGSFGLMKLFIKNQSLVVSLPLYLDKGIPPSLLSSLDAFKGVTGFSLYLQFRTLIGTRGLHVPVPPQQLEIYNTLILERLRMYYRLLKTKRGLIEILIPKELTRINCIETDETFDEAGEVIKVLECGRKLQFFYHPRGMKSSEIAMELKKLHLARPPNGLEFVRTLNRKAVLSVIIAPTCLSAVVIVVWLAVYLRKQKGSDDPADVQAVVTTAFTIAIYLVTAGGFIVGLAGYIDKPAEEVRTVEKGELKSNERNQRSRTVEADNGEISHGAERDDTKRERT